jgi:hypothetical protein
MRSCKTGGRGRGRRRGIAGLDPRILYDIVDGSEHRNRCIDAHRKGIDLQLILDTRNIWRVLPR